MNSLHVCHLIFTMDEQLYNHLSSNAKSIKISCEFMRTLWWCGVKIVIAESQHLQCWSPIWVCVKTYYILSMLVRWTPIYKPFWCSPGLQGFDPKPYRAALHSWTKDPEDLSRRMKLVYCGAQWLKPASVKRVPNQRKELITLNVEKLGQGQSSFPLKTYLSVCIYN